MMLQKPGKIWHCRTLRLQSPIREPDDEGLPRLDGNAGATPGGGAMALQAGGELLLHAQEKAESPRLF